MRRGCASKSALRTSRCAASASVMRGQPLRTLARLRTRPLREQQAEHWLLSAFDVHHATQHETHARGGRRKNRSADSRLLAQRNARTRGLRRASSAMAQGERVRIGPDRETRTCTPRGRTQSRRPSSFSFTRTSIHLEGRGAPSAVIRLPLAHRRPNGAGSCPTPSVRLAPTASRTRSVPPAAMAGTVASST
jgi:hypothetical protein